MTKIRAGGAHLLRASFDWRTLIVASALALATALPWMSTSVGRRDYFFFDVQLTSTSPGSTQVFWDLGRGYIEQDSSRQPLKIESEPVFYRYMIPMGTIRELRLDPVDGVGSFTFRNARVVDRKGNIVRAFPPEDFTAANEIARCEKIDDVLVVRTTPESRDPVLLLKLKTPLVLKSNAKIWFELGWPKALPVFLLAMLLGAPFVAKHLSRFALALRSTIARHPRSTIAVTAVLAVAVQSHPVLFQGRSFASPNNGALMLYESLPTLPGSSEYMYANTMGSDVGALLFQHIYYPMAQRRALLDDHELPLWNRYSLCGGPLLGQGQSMFGNPFTFLTMLANGNGWAWDVQFVTAHWLLAAGLGFIVWMLTRHLGAALLVTLGAGFISFFTHRLNHPATFSVCYAPWILWAWVGLIRAENSRRQTGWLLALLLANGIVMTSGTIKEAYMLIVCLNFAGIVLLTLLPYTVGRRIRIMGLVCGTGVVFILLSAPGWMSFLVAWKHSFSGYDTPGAQSLPFSQILGLFDDIFHRQTTKDEVVKAPGLNFLFLLGTLWWLVNPRSWRADRAGVAIALSILVPLSFAFGLVPTSLIVKIPFVANIIHTGNTFSCVLLILVSVLAGCGFAHAFRSVNTPGWWAAAGRIVVAGALLTGAYFLSTQSITKSPFFLGYAPALGLGAIVVLIGAAWAATGTTTRPGPIWAACLLGIPLLLWRHSQFDDSYFGFYAYAPGLRADFHARSPSVEFIDLKQADHGRIIGWGNNLFPSYNTALGWESLYGVDALRNRYYNELAVEFGMQRVWTWDFHVDEKTAQQLVPLHDVLNVTHYLGTKRDLPHPIAELEWLAQQDLDVYRSPHAWPRAFFTDRLALYSATKDFGALVRSGDRRAFAAVQVDEKISTSLSSTLSDRVVTPAQNYRLTSNTTSFTVEATAPGVVVLTEAYYPEDFRVTLNGAPVPFFRVNHAFKGVMIPAAGHYEVKFSYWPQYFDTALGLSGAGLILLAGGVIFLARRSPGTDQSTLAPIV
ncbi:MAG: hypothetical protein ABIO94_08515 [Opitutaceae bacterium]